MHYLKLADNTEGTCNKLILTIIKDLIKIRFCNKKNGMTLFNKCHSDYKWQNTGK